MSKSRDHIRRFLSSCRPAGQRDEHLIKLFFNKRKIKVSVPVESPDFENLDRITFEQAEAWYNSNMPTEGNVVRSDSGGDLSLIVHERWDSVVVGATLTAEGVLCLKERPFSAEKWVMASEQEVGALQKALSASGFDWNPISNTIEERSVPQSPKFVRLMVMGKQAGIGIFKKILPDHSLEMFCVKMENEGVRYSDDLNLGDADCFSFLDTYDEHRAVLQVELGEKGFIWNVKCRRVEKNNARAKVGKHYYWINGYFIIKQSTEKDTASDRLRFNRGNYFLSRDVAERAKDRIVNICKEEMVTLDNCRAR